MSPSAWDDRKAQANLRKHAVSFEEADTVIDSPLASRALDASPSRTESRIRVVGWSSAGRLLVVIVSGAGQPPRIISARRATKRERNDYTSG
ncbi:MAG: BrnT family toxin [Chloroflexi bacterium]|nr:BrnT family toxin [Chloroflexota bacterium]